MENLLTQQSKMIKSRREILGEIYHTLCAWRDSAEWLRRNTSNEIIAEQQENNYQNYKVLCDKLVEILYPQSR